MPYFPQTLGVYRFSFVQVASDVLRDLCVNEAHPLRPKDFRLGYASSPVKTNRAGGARFILSLFSFLVEICLIILTNYCFLYTYKIVTYQF